MECSNCLNYNIQKFKYDYNKLSNSINMIFTCDKCNYDTECVLHIKSHRKKEYHIPGYNNCGPGTDVIYNIRNDILPRNETDVHCFFHDIAYYIYKDKERRKKADKILYKNLLNLKKPHSISIPIINAILKIKMINNMY
ncbi:ORF MSV079 hypothetical protein with C2H2 zinc finger [Melanoplus sanguinipes entomopoxvirus]|uniref:Phospholipase A2-like domain-containing protein n=1 Tax=Melanoplus sanguinipes entomopoxvirus TaxID=83191 RepID=Q9YW13_MSEPV|nr:ORF MSV079 hypothetical protein with C2H2 zinc finger [Melanoplus sanguinipes entomopoxvirus]AAC97633.1 ORF MSV079 hypothetical protein with C2H2 zinc finger [Melanoplus sanguinipes entomopoxvirus 'O']